MALLMRMVVVVTTTVMQAIIALTTELGMHAIQGSALKPKP